MLLTTDSMLQLQLPVSLSFHQTSPSSRPKFLATNRISLPWCLLINIHIEHVLGWTYLLPPLPNLHPSSIPSLIYKHLLTQTSKSKLENILTSFSLSLPTYHLTLYLGDYCLNPVLPICPPFNALGVGPHHLSPTGLLQKPNTCLPSPHPPTAH